MAASKLDRGASVVEFAIVAPVLFALLFGIIDFGWAFSQNLDVKHAAREGARLGAVNAGTGSTPEARRHALISEIRARSTELADNQTEVFVTLADGSDDNTTEGDIGDSVVICMRYPLRSITGATTQFLPSHLTTKAVMRMEKIPNFSSGGSTSPVWGGSTCTP